MQSKKAAPVTSREREKNTPLDFNVASDNEASWIKSHLHVSTPVTSPGRETCERNSLGVQEEVEGTTSSAGTIPVGVWFVSCVTAQHQELLGSQEDALLPTATYFAGRPLYL